MRRLATVLVSVFALGGFVAFAHVRHESVYERRFDEERGRYVTELVGDDLEVGLPFSPWYWESKCSSPHCGTVSSHVSVLSWSWLALGMGVGGAYVAFRMWSRGRRAS